MDGLGASVGHARGLAGQAGLEGQLGRKGGLALLGLGGETCLARLRLGTLACREGFRVGLGTGAGAQARGGGATVAVDLRLEAVGGLLRLLDLLLVAGGLL